jgi:hypothetical protein
MFLSALVLCMSSSVLGSEVEKPAVEVSEKVLASPIDPIRTDLDTMPRPQLNLTGILAGYCGQRGGSANNEADGHCAENPEKNTSGGNDHTEAEPDVENDGDNLESDDGESLAAEVEAAFTDITDLLTSQVKSLHDLQMQVQQQVARVNALKLIAAKGFAAYQQAGKVKHIQASLRQHSGNILGTFREHSVNNQGTFREHSGNIQGTCSEHPSLPCVRRMGSCRTLTFVYIIRSSIC